MKIAVINPFGGGTVYSGPSVLMNRLFERLADRHEITVLYGRRNAQDEGIAWATCEVPVMTFGKYGPLEQFLWALRVSIWMIRNRQRFDIVHIHGSSFFNLLTAIVPLLRRQRYVLLPVSGGGDISAEARTAKIPILSLLRRTLVSRAYLGFALSEQISDEFAALGLPPEKIRSMWNPVDIREFAPQSVIPDPRAMIRTIGFVGVLGQRKRAHLILDVLTLLRGRGFPEAKAVFLGPFENTHYEQRFRSQIRRQELDDAVELRGYTKDVALVLRTEVSVLVNASAKEGFPGALAEAMASGLPAVVTDVGAMAIVGAAAAGYVVSPSANEIAVAVEQTWRDESLWHSQSRCARKFALDNFDLTAVADKYSLTLASRPPATSSRSSQA